MIYAFCEPHNCAPGRGWCIRVLSPLGLRTGGGIDTPSLCGRVKSLESGGVGGHDFSLSVDDILEKDDAREVCRECLVKWRTGEVF